MFLLIDQLNGVSILIQAAAFYGYALFGDDARTKRFMRRDGAAGINDGLLERGGRPDRADFAELGTEARAFACHAMAS